MSDPGAGHIVPDTKDWTWTLDRACPDCGFDAAAVRPEDLPGLVTVLTDPWPHVLAREEAARRPEPGTWSPLEYGCHVRDVCRVFDERTRLLLEQDDPTFANWDQDEAAAAQAYGAQDPGAVAAEILEAAGAWAGTVAGIGPDAWDRPATRSNGSRFTALSLTRYGLHDLAHHLWDVGVTRP